MKEDKIPKLGTPGEERRLKEARLEKLYHKAFVIAGALIVILVTLYGYGSHEPRFSGITYKERANRLAEGRMACELDVHEGCLVCLHREARGVLISTHC
jgi:hypothetical protein